MILSTVVNLVKASSVPRPRDQPRPSLDYPGYLGHIQDIYFTVAVNVTKDSFRASEGEEGRNILAVVHGNGSVGGTGVGYGLGIAAHPLPSTWYRQ